MSYNHLIARSDFSIGESLLQTGSLATLAKERGYESVVLTDTMSLNSMIDFSNKAKKEGIKYVVGCRLRVYDDPTYRLPSKTSGIERKPNPMFCPKVYALGEKGVHSIMKLLTKGSSADYFYYHSRVGLAEVLELEDVAISTGDLFNLFHHPEAALILAKLQLQFGNDKVFVEICPINTPLFERLNEDAISVATTHVAPLLATYPALYKDAEDANTLEVLNAIATNTAMDTPWRNEQYVKDFYVKTPKEFGKQVVEAALKSGKKDQWVSGLRNVEKLVAMCNYSFEKLKPCLPVMAANEFGELTQKCLEGWKKRFASPVLGHRPTAVDLPVYRERLQFELTTLRNMGFSGYFLLVEDLVGWAKKNDVIVGPGRGSVGGSLVAYLLGITDVDPIRFDLLFERFINPERQDLPDADLDFMSSRRHLVVEYLTEKYGKDRVAGISNYSTMASASALRDAGRMFGLSGLDLMATKLVPKEHGQSFTLTDAAKAVPELMKFKDDFPQIWGHALKLEGCMRSMGQHAAGIIVAGEPLTERAVVETRSDSPVVNWDKRTVEDWGLIKMDLLGLSTLDVMEIARQYIKQRHGKSIEYTKLPLEEDDIMGAFGRGETTGIFQFESSGVKRLLRSLAEGGPLTFEDITAATALYRPGPMDSGLMDDFVQIKRGLRSPSYEHPKMENALKSTYGVIVYQEQVMQLAVDLAGFTQAQADNLRKAMGKKDKDKMAEQKDKFVNGAVLGQIEVELEDGAKKVVHRASKFMCVDGVKRTVEEAIAAKIDISQW